MRNTSLKVGLKDGNMRRTPSENHALPACIAFLLVSLFVLKSLYRKTVSTQHILHVCFVAPKNSTLENYSDFFMNISHNRILYGNISYILSV